jgi:TPR repeat protein
MRNNILLLYLFAFSQIAFSQNTGKKGTYGIATGGIKGNKQEIPKQNINYEETAFINNCFSNFAFTVKNYGYNKDGKFYSWGIRVKNNYSQAVQLKYKLIVGNDKPTNGTLTYYVKPGETYSNDFGKAQAIIVGNNSEKYKIEVSEVCFEGQDCIHNGYVECGGNVSNLNSNQKTIETKSNELSPYKMYRLGNSYYFGSEGLRQDYVKAIFYLEKASENGQSIASYQLAEYYETGKGGIIDLIKAKEYYKKSCDQGFKSGCIFYKRM